MSSGSVFDDSGSETSRSGASRQKEEQGESGVTWRAATSGVRRRIYAATRGARVCLAAMFDEFKNDERNNDGYQTRGIGYWIRLRMMVVKSRQRKVSILSSRVS